jgi:hypothetical protein
MPRPGHESRSGQPADGPRAPGQPCTAWPAGRHCQAIRRLTPPVPPGPAGAAAARHYVRAPAVTPARRAAAAAAAGVTQADSDERPGEPESVTPIQSPCGRSCYGYAARFVQVGKSRSSSSSGLHRARPAASPQCVTGVTISVGGCSAGAGLPRPRPAFATVGPGPVPDRRRPDVCDGIKIEGRAGEQANTSDTISVPGTAVVVLGEETPP